MSKNQQKQESANFAKGKNKRGRAVVIGGSLAGLLSARVLSSHFAEVIVLERDPVGTEPEARKGQRHILHTHILLKRGLDVLQDLFPRLLPGLKAKGARVVDFAANARWYVAGGMKKRHSSDLHHLLVSRPLLEAEIRAATLNIPNVRLMSNCACKHLLFDSDSNVVGAIVEDRHTQRDEIELEADLVVDASGRGSRAAKWLDHAGFKMPVEQRIESEVEYATRMYKHKKSQPADSEIVVIQPVGPDESLGGCLVPIEGNQMICTLSGRGGKSATADPEKYEKFAAELPSQAISDAIKGLVPQGDIRVFKYPASRWRRFDLLRKHPGGFIVIGDAVCSFNPIFGQGMSSAACQVEVLDMLLSTGCSPEKLWRTFYRKCSGVIGNAWKTAASGDFQFSHTKGKKPTLFNVTRLYVNAVQMTCHSDELVYRAYLRVTNLLASPHSLLSPRILVRVAVNVVQRAFSKRVKNSGCHRSGHLRTLET